MSDRYFKLCTRKVTYISFQTTCQVLNLYHIGVVDYVDYFDLRVIPKGLEGAMMLQMAHHPKKHVSRMFKQVYPSMLFCIEQSSHN